MLGINDLKVNTKIVLDGDPYIITDSQHSKQARGGAIVRTSLKNLITGHTLPKTFQGADKVEQADIQSTKAQYLYTEGNMLFLMNNDTYEQFELDMDIVGNDIIELLPEGTELDVLMFNDKPINISLPSTVILKVTEAEIGAKGNTASGSASKNVTLETGLVVQAPQFIKEGDRLKVNTDTKSYIERVL